MSPDSGEKDQNVELLDNAHKKALYHIKTLN